MIRITALLIGLAVLVGCAGRDDLTQTPEPLGDFKLGHNIVIASKAQRGPVSRNASEGEWTSALEQAIDDRFGRYTGENFYHFGVSVEGYMLAPPGVPLIYTPKSALILNVTVWDDGAGRKLNDEPHQVLVFENTDENSIIIGSGIGRNKQEQLQGLSFNAARAIETWLEEQYARNRWFTDDPVFNPAPVEKPKEDR